MATITKKELIDRIADATGTKRVTAKRVIQSFLDEVIEELGRGNRLEFRDFGVFEHKDRKGRVAQNPKTLEQVRVAPKRIAKFKMGRLMKKRLQDGVNSRPGADDSPGRSDRSSAAAARPGQ